MKQSVAFFQAITVITILFALSACIVDTSSGPSSSSHAHWSYEGEEGPDHWGELDSAYELCKNGQNQSPINISLTSSEDLANISFHYAPSKMNILHNGHTVQVNYDAGSYMELDGVRYDVAQFHYHVPSEHQVDGKSFAAELHIVHKNVDGQFAVVALLFQEGSTNSALAPFVDHLPVEKTDETDAGIQINAIEFLPIVQTTYRYSGSLTTPPCSEEVNWLVMTTPVELSPTQLSTLASLFEANNRPVQPLLGRSIREDNTP